MLIADSSGRKSWHLTLAVPSLIAGTIWFLAGGVSVELPFGMKLVTSTKSGADYLLFVGPWLSALGWRDYLKQDQTTKFDQEKHDASVPAANPT